MLGTGRPWCLQCIHNAHVQGFKRQHWLSTSNDAACFWDWNKFISLCTSPIYIQFKWHSYISGSYQMWYTMICYYTWRLIEILKKNSSLIFYSIMNPLWHVSCEAPFRNWLHVFLSMVFHLYNPSHKIKNLLIYMPLQHCLQYLDLFETVDSVAIEEWSEWGVPLVTTIGYIICQKLDM